MRRLVVATAVLAFVAAACTAGGGDEPAPTVDTAASNEPVTVELTGEWMSNRECDEWQSSFKDGFESEYPWITVDAKCGVTEEQQIAAINAGNPPDAFLSFGVDNVGRFCDSGAWADLNPYIDGPERDRPQRVPGSRAHVHELRRTQCSLPFLTDTTGLYYNLDMFEKAGLSEPPKTTDELTEYAKALTQFNADGSIEVAGFVPVTDYYCCSQQPAQPGPHVRRDVPR